MNDNNNNDRQYHSTAFCHFHPNQPLLGVCPFCLNEKLLPIAAQRARRNRQLRRQEKTTGTVSLAKIFALGSLLNRLELRHRGRRRCYDDGDAAGDSSDYQSTSSSLEDSFISIQFGENGVALWDNSKLPNTSQLHSNRPCRIDLTKQPNWKPNITQGSLRWRKRIGRLLQLARWNKPTRGNGGTKGCMSTLTCRRTSKDKKKGLLGCFFHQPRKEMGNGG